MAEAFIVIGASVLQRSLVEQAQARGLAVCTVDGAADAPATALAEHPLLHDFGDVDGLPAALERAGIRPLGVATMGSDFAVHAVARVAAAYGLPGLTAEMAHNATDKEEMLRRFGALGDVSAPSRIVGSLDEARAAYRAVGPRVIVKPCDASGQRGTSEVASETELALAIAHALAASRAGRVVVEAYVDGVEYAVSGFVVDGRYVATNLTERCLHPPPVVGVCVQHRFPSGLAAETEALVHDATGRAALSLDIDGVPVYAQARIQGGRPFVFEIGPRLGGGKDAELCRLVRGVDQVEAVIDAALGELTPASLRRRHEPVDACGASAFPVVAPGRIVRLGPGSAFDVPGVHDVGFFWRAGQTLTTLRSSGGRLGCVLLTAPDLPELERRRLAAFEALDVVVER